MANGDDQLRKLAIVPAFNEAGMVARVIRDIRRHAPDFDIVVVDDGSTDDTAGALSGEEFASVRVVRQTNGGKAKALDTGIRLASHDIVVLIDGDTLLEPRTLTELIRPFTDDRVGAVAGNARVGNLSTLVAKIQHVEYTIASAIERRAFDELGVMLCVPGAVGAFRRQAVIEVGGVSSDTLAEDTDLTLAVARAGWRVSFAPEARAWTEVPSSMRGLFRQRLRWNYGILQAIAKHRGAVRQRGRSGRPGRVVLPYVIVMGYLATLAAPALDLLLLIQIVTGSLTSATVALWCAGLVSTVLLGVFGLAYEGERVRWAALLPVQQLLYRQLLYITVFKAIGAAFSGIRLPWNKLERTADVTVGTDAPAVALEEVVIDLRTPTPADASRDGARAGAGALVEEQV
ncbi:MAG: glycosyltransferase [Actinomycetota bacterium]|nr:glycosyltransferase [Actinomycetota bacterium]